MDLGIKELGATFVVGMFTLLAIDAVLFYFFNVPFVRFFKDRIGFEDKSTAVIVAVLAFAVGLLVEDISYKYGDDGRFPEVRAAAQMERMTSALVRLIHPRKVDEVVPEDDAWLPGIFASRQSIRMDVLVSADELIHDGGRTLPTGVPDDSIMLCDPKATADREARIAKAERQPHLVPSARFYRLEATGQGRGVGTAKLLSRTGVQVHGLAGGPPGLEAWLHGANSPAVVSRACRALVAEGLERLYYHAKNVVFQKPELFDEMSKIEMRFDFARSILVVAWAFLVFAQTLLIAVVARRATLLFVERRRWRRPAIWAGASAIAAVLLVFAGLHVFGESTVVLWIAAGAALGLAVAGICCLFGVDKSLAARVAPLRASGTKGGFEPSIATAALTVMVFIGFYLIGAIAYRHEQREFDKRAYGYFETIVRMASADSADRPLAASVQGRLDPPGTGTSSK